MGARPFARFQLRCISELYSIANYLDIHIVTFYEHTVVYAEFHQCVNQYILLILINATLFGTGYPLFGV